MEINLPFNNGLNKGNYFGHKVCYDCGQVYDGRFGSCINCGSGVWDNLRTYEKKNGRILINEIKTSHNLNKTQEKKR